MDFIKAGMKVKCLVDSIPKSSMRITKDKIYLVQKFDQKGDNPDWNYIIDDNDVIRIINNSYFKPYFEVVNE